MSQYKTIAELPEYTVVSEYTPSEQRSDSYQSEADLEKDFIKRLQKQGYEYLPIHSESELVANLRKQIELLNDFTFTDSEWKQFFSQHIANQNEGIEEKTLRIQEDCRIAFKLKDGSTKNITLIDKRQVHNNRLQVINQYEESKGKHESRYDVTILVNGLPLVHVELKRRGVALKEAFNQIKRYQRDSFWAGSGLYEYVQIFVISNGTHTKYYSNTTREAHIREMTDSGRKQSRKTSNSFEFTSYWADGKNNIINDLVDFTRTFFSKHSLLNILTRFCVFTSEKLLLVMRPYQIRATEAILQQIAIANNYKTIGTLDAGGYIWHTTGSGKTLTSFKTAQLATQLPYIDKVLFVVDRKDLDYQTIREYDRFQKGAANGNSSTAILKKQLEDATTRIIITTIQKLGYFIKQNPRHDIYQKHLVMVFDECHRSQFGDLHIAITRAFKNYHLFGFTGTPIFAVNAGTGGKAHLKTTQQAFGNLLHTYTIVNAINDGNVLPFRIDYISTVKMKDDVQDARVMAIDTEKAMLAPERIGKIVDYILDHFDQKTKRNTSYSLKGQRVMGFNSILAVASIPAAQVYYEALKERMAARKKQLNIATIYSYAANEADPEDTIMGDESMDTESLDKTSRDFLDHAIDDYNRQFNTNYDTSSAKFENYYKDLSQRMKAREIDLLLVVNMFLTGFDATTLNTLWVDKNLRMHGLIQAYSRTNRILNSVKNFGNIVCFRNLQKETDDAIALFGDENAGGIVLLKGYADYYNGYDEAKDSGETRHVKGYAELVAELQNQFPIGAPIVGEQAEKDFIALFGSILRVRNILSSFDEFAGNEILAPAQMQDYQSIYLDMRDKYKPTDPSMEDINGDIVFEMELIRQIEVNIDYILLLVEKYHASNCKDKTILTDIDKAISSNPDLRSKRELIRDFVNRVDNSASVADEWKAYVATKREEELEKIIDEEHLKPEQARAFLKQSFEKGSLKTIGQDIQNILPPSNPFDKNSGKKKRSIIERIKEFFEKYFGLVC